MKNKGTQFTISYFRSQKVTIIIMKELFTSNQKLFSLAYMVRKYRFFRLSLLTLEEKLSEHISQLSIIFIFPIPAFSLSPIEACYDGKSEKCDLMMYTSSQCDEASYAN